MTDSAGYEIARARFDRVVILAEENLDPEEAKTAGGIIRYGQCHVVAVIDSKTAGADLEAVLGTGRGIPVVGSLREALAFQPQALVIGTAPRGGALPPEWRAIVLEAVEAGLDVVSGLHTYLSDDPEIAARARERGVVVADVRRPPAVIPVAEDRCHKLAQNVVLTVGTDCCVGKMTVSLELMQEARRRGIAADFVPTGQTGILIWGRGISVDSCVADFIAGAAEQMVLEAAQGADWVFVEGQGSLFHPGYSGVTFGLIHGCEPRQMVFCHQAGRDLIGDYDIQIPSLSEAIRYHETVLQPLFPTRVSAVALNTWGMPDDKAREAISEAERETGLPADDCVRYGAGKILDALMRNVS